MTDEELAARAIHANWYEDDIAPTLDYERSRGDVIAVERCERLGAAVVAALRDAGRLMPDGCVAVDRGRWDRVRRLAAWGQVLSKEQDNQTTIGLRNVIHEIGIVHGDLDSAP